MSDLRARRELAGLSQEELGGLIGITQDQVSRYETGPGAAPGGLQTRWLALCEAGAALAAAPDLKLGQPYAALGARLGLLEQFLVGAPPSPAEVPDLAVTPERLRERVQAARERPVVVLAGKFDSGKTRIVNTLLGGWRLPCGYQPTTAVSAFIRHLELKPAWQREPVWILRRGFDPSRWFDQAHCEQHRLAAGSWDLLDRFAAMGPDGRVPQPGAFGALVYADAPILHACTLVDLPGFEDTQAQAELAEAAMHLGDVVVYTSMAKGFLGMQDRVQIAQLLRRSLGQIPDDPLGNLLLVATHADPSITDAQLDAILDRGAQALYRHVKDGVLRELAPTLAGAKSVRGRMVTFWAEAPARRQGLERELARLLGEVLPPLVQARVDGAIAQARSAGTEAVRQQIAAFEHLLQDQQSAQEQIARLRQAEPGRRARVQAFTQTLQDHLRQLRASTTTFIASRVEPALAPAAIEDFIRAQFEDKEEAREGAAGKLLEDLQASVEARLKADSEQLQIHIQRFLNAYSQVSLEAVAAPAALQIPFDARGTFLAALTGAGTLGALGTWAASVGSLSSPVLVTRGVSDLAALGLSINAAAAVGVVAAIGGPVTVAVGLAAVTFGVIKTLFGESWQARLARQMSRSLADSEFLAKLQHGAAMYWDDTAAAIQSGLDGLESGYEAYLAKLEGLAAEQVGSAGSRARIESALQRLQGLQDFFGQLPWRCSS